MSALLIYIPGDAVAVACGADGIAAAIAAAAAKRKIDIKIARNGSRGMHWLEPMLEVATAGGRIAYGPVELADIEGVLDAMIAGGGDHKLRVGVPEEHPFLKKQTRLTFARCGIVDPRSLEDCELQDMAGAVGLRDVRYGYAGENHVFAKAGGKANPNWLPKDESNPYFTYDPSKCIVCSRCVRACEETQGTFALTIASRGFDSRVSPGMEEPFMSSECVSCGACVQACPTATLNEKMVIEIGKPEHSVVTTCAYCGVGCSFKAEMRGDELVRMVPYKDGEANRGHSCVKGRFAWGYATHRERILTPMIRAKVTDLWKEVSWDEAINHAASEFKRIQAKYGKQSVGGITSSRCTNEETFLVQKLIRGVWQQQCRYLRTGLPLADRLRPRPNLRHLGRHAELRFR